jgi:hypothetical protein
MTVDSAESASATPALAWKRNSLHQLIFNLRLRPEFGTVPVAMDKL